MIGLQYSPRHLSYLCDSIRHYGTHYPSARGDTYEILDANLLADKPRDRLSFDPARRMNLAFGIAEFLTLLSGNDSLAIMQQFVKGYNAYSTDGRIVDGSYARRIQPAQGKSQNQIYRVIEMLTENPDSRQAVVTFYNFLDLWGAGGKNTPCTLTAQFLLRNNVLHMIVNMRSNDVWKGLTYDLFSFTMLHEFVAYNLNAGLGIYHHNAGSLHIYEADLPQITQLTDPDGPIMLPMPKTAELGGDIQELSGLLTAMVDIEYHPYHWERALNTQYARDLLNVLLFHKAYRRHDTHIMRLCWDSVSDPAIRKVLSLWLSPQ